jgi:hypothetical protein
MIHVQAVAIGQGSHNNYAQLLEQRVSTVYTDSKQNRTNT